MHMSDPKHFLAELRGWSETDAMSDDARRKVWLLHRAADEIERLRDKIEALQQLTAGLTRNDPREQ